MCVHINWSSIQSVKVIGPKIGRGSATSMRDGDGDGRCQEEDGKWVPCPPGVATGSVISAASGATLGTTIGELGKQTLQQRAMQKVRERREKAATKAARIHESARQKIDVTTMWHARNVVELVEEARNTKSRNRLMEIEQEIQESLSEAFQTEIRGLDDKVYEIDLSPDDIEWWREAEQATLRGVIREKRSGRAVGEFERVLNLNDQEAYHEILKLGDKEQGQGIASAFNARNEIIYRELGINIIRTSALSGNGWKGATHWPRNGFDWASESSKADFLATVYAALRKHDRIKSLDGSSSLFNSAEEADEVKELLRIARQQSLSDSDRLTAADFLHWNGAEKFFQDAHADIEYRRDI